MHKPYIGATRTLRANNPLYIHQRSPEDDKFRGAPTQEKNHPADQWKLPRGSIPIWQRGESAGARQRWGGDNNNDNNISTEKTKYRDSTSANATKSHGQDKRKIASYGEKTTPPTKSKVPRTQNIIVIFTNHYHQHHQRRRVHVPPASSSDTTNKATTTKKTPTTIEI